MTSEGSTHISASALLNKHAPIKKKIMRFNNNPFMSKALRKAIMHRSKLKNIYNNYRTRQLGKLRKTKKLLHKSSSQD